MNKYDIPQDPNWPENPPAEIICVLCKTSMPFDKNNPERFFRHLIADHCTYFNLNLLLEISQIQPTQVREEVTNKYSAETEAPQVFNDPGQHKDENIKRERLNSRRSTSESAVNLENWEGSGLEENPSYGNANVHHEEIVAGAAATSVDQLNVNFFLDQLEGKTGVQQESPGMRSDPAQPVPTQPDFSELDPISFVSREPKVKRTRQSVVNKNNQPVTQLPDNPNRHLVPEDLQRLIITSNPKESIKFTYSQRMNTQMMLNDFVLKKKKGPYMSRGARIINWKCVNDACQFTAVTWEGEIQENTRSHNHPPQPELYIKKQARLKIRDQIIHNESEDRPMSNLVNQLVNETNGEVREMIGSIDALKQAARRFNRKRQKDVRVQDSQENQTAGYENFPQFVPVSDLENYEVVQEFPADVQFVAIGDDFAGYQGETEVIPVEYFKQEPVLEEEQEQKQVVYYQQSQEVKQGDSDDLEELLQESPCKQNAVEVRTE